MYVYGVGDLLINSMYLIFFVENIGVIVVVSNNLFMIIVYLILICRYMVMKVSLWMWVIVFEILISR